MRSRKLFKMNVPLVVFFICHLAIQAFAVISNLGNNEFNDDENKQYIKETNMDSTSDNTNSDNHFTDTLPGNPALDYPTYTIIPHTSFTCKGKLNWHYYADIDTECQVFHVCETQRSKISFICPIGSVFNQRHLICDWWYNVDCTEAVSLYTLNNEYNDHQLLVQAQDPKDQEGFDLSLASSGGNFDPSQSESDEHFEYNSSKNETKRNPVKKDQRRKSIS